MVLSKENISETLTAFVKNNILAQGVEFRSESILSKSGVDSYSVIEIILFIERQYGILIPDQQLIPENLSTIDSLSGCVFALLSKK